MGYKAVRCLGDFVRYDADVMVRCRSCRRTRRFDALEFSGQFGPMGSSLLVSELRRRLKCSACGHRGADIAPVPMEDQARHGIRARRFKPVS